MFSTPPSSDLVMSPKDKENGGFALAIIGCGAMGTSILTGILNAKAKGASTDSNINRFIATVHTMASMELGDDGVLQAMQKADIVLLSCKPYIIEGILALSGVKEALVGKLVISVAAGLAVGKMTAALGIAEPTAGKGKERDISPLETTIVRAMPNLAASFGESNTVVEISPSMPLSVQNKSIVRYIFGCVGSIVEVGPAQYDAAGVLAAASMAFLTVAIDGILDGGVKEGIKRGEGRGILVRSLKGLVGLLEGKGDEDEDGGRRDGKGKGKGRTGDEIREQFSSPRGTTIEGLVGLEEDRVRYAYCRSVVRATKRSLEM
ncbi:hypothetical protein DID88_001030 [Monilinia fructigena]|uniref:Pyrroline-5-carboxylate reductase n=1 Tax=Monilinia fructigena TaxID=38457 RepID=A0A395J051_9HELO|nr:hypothetical protein DID88_001030 [Monilinia fructigena]